MPDSRKKKKTASPWLRWVKFVVLGFFVLLCVGILTFPFWSPWATKSLVAAYTPAQVEQLESIGSGQWQARGLTLELDGFSLVAETVVLPSATQLAGNYLLSSEERKPLRVEDWTATITPGESEKSETGAGVTPAMIKSITDQVVTELQKYFSTVELSRGSIFLAEKEIVSVPDLVFDNSALSGQARYLPFDLEIDFNLENLSTDQWALTVDTNQSDLSGNASLTFGSSTLALDGTVTSLDNSAILKASWAKDQPMALPDSATFSSDALLLDERYAFWGGAPTLIFDGTIDWNDQSYSFRIDGVDTSEINQLPNMEIAGRGTLNSLEITAATIDLPWLYLQNDQPLVFDFTLENPLSEAELVARVDLSRIPFIEAEGTVQATLRTLSTEEALPVIEANFNGSSITFFDTIIETLTANLVQVGTRCEVRELQMSSQNGSSLALSGNYDLDTHSLHDVVLNFKLLNESGKLREFLPDIDWDQITVESQAEGPIQDLNANGVVGISSLTTKPLSPLDLEVEFDGNLRALETRITARNEIETLFASVDARFLEEQINLSIEQMNIVSNEDAEILQLSDAFTVTISPSAPSIRTSPVYFNFANASQVSIEDFSLSPDHLMVDADIIEFDPSVLKNWLQTSIPPLIIEAFGAQLDLSPEASSLSTNGVATWTVNDRNTVNLSWLLNTSQDSTAHLEIDHLDIGADGKHILQAEGAFPVSASWSQFAFVPQIENEAPINLSIQSVPHPDFWRSLEEHLPIGITRPVLNANVSGTLKEPQGTFDLSLNSLQWNKVGGTDHSIAVNDIRASLFADTQTLEIRSLNASAGTNTLDIQATLPLSEVDFEKLLKNSELPDLSKASGHASLSLSQLDIIDPWLPDFVRDEGQIQLNIDMDSQDLRVVAELSDFATRAMPPLGSISGINGQLVFENNILTANNLTGVAEKSDFRFNGTVDLSDYRAPVYDLSFKSKEFPLVRDSGLLLSGDIDLQLVSTKTTQPTLKGSLQLTKGLFLVEPDLLASPTKTVSTRPPYFSVKQSPFNAWGLNVAVRGDEFLTVSNSFFEGILSADLNLEGTLGDPLLIGRAEADSGRVFFPATSLQLTNGQAFITRERPSELQLEASANGRLFAYDVDMTASGAIENLDVIITTHPALTQVEALLLLTTGALPDQTSGIAEKSATTLGVFFGKGLFRKLTGNSGNTASRFEIEIGRDISRQGKNTIETSYELTDTLEIEGEYDKRDEYNANLKWTIYEN